MGARKQPCQETKELRMVFTALSEGLSLGVHSMATSVPTMHKLSSSPSWTARKPIYHTSFLPSSFALSQAKLSRPWEVQRHLPLSTRGDLWKPLEIKTRMSRYTNPWGGERNGSAGQARPASCSRNCACLLEQGPA